MRYLCLGSVRANALAYALTLRGHEAIAVGLLRLTQESLAYLAWWADVVLVTHPDQANRLPEEHRGKVTCIELGDFYGRTFGGWHHPELMGRVERGLDQILGSVPCRLFPEDSRVSSRT